MSWKGLCHVYCSLLSLACVWGGEVVSQGNFQNLNVSLTIVGEGRIRATWGWISVDRGSKATLPLTMPRRVFKSSAKDSAHRPLGRELRGGRPRHVDRTGLANGTGPWGRKRP